MIVTFNSSYSQITISSSTALSGFIDDQISSLVLEVIRNCGTTTTHTIALDDIDTVNEEYTVTATILNQGSVFAEGVYSFKLKYRDNPVVVNTVYKYIGTSITCKIIDWYAKYLECLEAKPCDQNIFYWVFVFDNLLQRFEQGSCNDFTYANACKLYNKLLELLTNTVNDDCGCD